MINLVDVVISEIIMLPPTRGASEGPNRHACRIIQQSAYIRRSQTLTARNTLIARPRSSSLYISPITPAPNTRPGEAPTACRNLQSKRLGISVAE